MFVLWAALYSPLFRVKRFEIVGNRDTKTEDIKNFLDTRLLSASLINTVLGFENMLSWRAGSFQNSAPELPRVRAFVVTKSYVDRTVQVAVEERRPFGIWCAMETTSCFWFDEEGVLLESAPRASGNLIPVVHDYSGKYLRSQTKVYDEQTMQNIVSIFKALMGAKLGVREVRLDDRDREEVNVILQQGPALYFSTRFRADEAGAALASLIKTGGSGKSFSQFEYVDFRVEHRAYYK